MEVSTSLATGTTTAIRAGILLADTKDRMAVSTPTPNPVFLIRRKVTGKPLGPDAMSKKAYNLFTSHA